VHVVICRATRCRVNVTVLFVTQVFKKARGFGLGDLDFSAVYKIIADESTSEGHL
jgi:hypothetical protein